MTLTPHQRERYDRHLKLPDIGETGQHALLRTSVLLVGAGGLGSPAGLYLAAAGIGRLGIMDGDRLELSNLQRQILHGEGDVGRSKASSAADGLRQRNTELTLEVLDRHLTRENAAGLLPSYDFVIDATDNFPSKFLIADACHTAGTPVCHGGIAGFYGQLITVLPGHSACYRCLFEDVPAERESDRAPAGPVGALPGIIGSLQALEAIKFATGAGDLLTNRILTFDGLAGRFRTIHTRPRRTCALCFPSAG